VQAVVFRFVNTLVIYIVCLVLQTLSSGLYLSLSGLMFSVACVIFPMIMQIRAAKMVPARPVWGRDWITAPPVAWTALVLSLSTFAAMIVLFVRASSH